MQLSHIMVIMKNLIAFYLLGTLTGFSQTAKINDITLSFDRKKNKMVLVMPSHNFYLPLEDNDLTVYIHKEFSLKMIIDGNGYSVSEPYFEYLGYMRETSGFSELKHNESGGLQYDENVNPFISKNTSFMFSNLEKGEYILEVVRRCGNYEEYRKQTSLIIK
jgi:hypothetical protein